MLSEFRPLGIILASSDSLYPKRIREDFPQVNWVDADSEKRTADLMLLVIEADRGISNEDIARFHSLRETQIPAIILITSLITDGESDRWDFDDLTMLANRTLEEVTTPYLVLHDDKGQPSGLYELATDTVIDYSVSPEERRPADEDLKTLTAEFGAEFREQDFDISDFISGLRVVALPYIPERKVGIAETVDLITRLEPIRS